MSQKFGVCSLAAIPMRSEPSDRSEMVSQLLFGEHFEIIEEQQNWIKVKCWFDDYEGWIDQKQSILLTEAEFQNLSFFPSTITSAFFNELIDQDRRSLFIPIGSTLPGFTGNSVFLSNTAFAFAGEAVMAGNFSKSNLMKLANLYANSPYLWGGRSPSGIDCSGFTQLVFKIMGIRISRDASQQAEKGEIIHFTEEILPGDLLFFDNEEGKIIHVGIALNEQNIVHASGKVRFDRFDHVGIYNQEQKRYSHKLRIVKRIGIIQ